MLIGLIGHSGRGVELGRPAAEVGGEVDPDDVGAAPAEGVGREGEELGELHGVDTVGRDGHVVGGTVNAPSVSCP